MYQRTIIKLALFACLICTGVACAQVAPPNMLNNGGFEAPFNAINPRATALPNGALITGNVANGWEDNSSWAKVTTNYAEEKDQPHDGQSCQKVEVKEVSSGAAQLVQRVALQANQVYRASVWLRSPNATPIGFSLRQAGVPYKTYAEKWVLLPSNNEWQHVEIAALVPDTVQAYLMLRTASPMTYYVDDATLENVTQSANNQAPRVGNLLPDGSFETGLGDGWSVLVRLSADVTAAARNEYLDPRPRLDTTAATGTHSLRVDIPAGMMGLIYSPLVNFNFNRPHVISMWLKASRPVSALIALGAGIQSKVAVGTQWSRVIVKGTPTYAPQTSLVVHCEAGAEPLTVWLDGAMLEERAEPSPNYIPAFPVELSLNTNRPGSIFFDGEDARINVSTAWDSASPVQQEDAHLALQLEDVQGDIIKLPSQKLPTSQVIIAPDAKHPRGIWKLHAQVVDAAGKVLSAPTEQVFARLPHPRSLTPAEAENSYFGVHIPLSPEYIQIAKDIGARWVRLHDFSTETMWAVVEAKKGQWLWIDDGVDAARKAGLNILGMIDGTPAWASKTPRATWGYESLYNQPNANGAIADWQEYARRTSEHFKGRINYWAIWNEPWGSLFTPGTPEDYAALLRAATPAIKSANPEAKVLGVSASANMTVGAWAAPVIAAAPSSFYDIIDFHDYSGVFSYGDINHAPARFVNSLESILAQHGGTRPLWDTESGTGLSSWYASSGNGLSPQQQLAWIVSSDVTQMGAGVHKFFLYTLGGGPPQGTDGLCALEHDRSIKPLLAARAVLAYLVDGAKYTGRTEPQPGVDQYAFRFPNGKTVAVLWSYDDKTHQVQVPGNTTVLDVMGNHMPVNVTVPIVTEPVYFVPNEMIGLSQ